MVVGEEGVGKTSLIKRLLSHRWIGDTFDGYEYQKLSPLPPTFPSPSSSTSSTSSNNNSSNNIKQSQEVQQKVYRTGITDGIDIHLYQPKGQRLFYKYL